MAGILWERSGSVDLKSRSEIASWYMFIWKVSEKNLAFQHLLHPSPSVTRDWTFGHIKIERNM